MQNAQVQGTIGHGKIRVPAGGRSRARLVRTLPLSSRGTIPLAGVGDFKMFYQSTSYTPGKWGTIDFSFFTGAGFENRGGFPVGGQLGLPRFEIDWRDPALSALGAVIAPWIQSTPDEPRESVPEIRTTLPGREAPIFVDESVGGPLLVPPGPSGAEVIDPEYRPETTVYENAPGGIYEVERAPTDWDEYYRRYVELNVEEEPVFDFWTGVVDTGIDWGSSLGLWGGAPQQQVQTALPGYPSMAPGGAAAMPAKVTVDTRTGKVTPCKRRRRRKLLTESDFNVLLRVATLPNKENVRIVLGKAIGRS